MVCMVCAPACCGLNIGLADGEERGRVVLELRQASFHLRQLGLPLFHGSARGFDGGAIGGNGSLLRFSGGRDLIELLLRNFFILDEQRVARKIGLGFGGVGLGFGETGDGGFSITLGNPNHRYRIGDVGLAPLILVLLSTCVMGTLGCCAVTWRIPGGHRRG